MRDRVVAEALGGELRARFVLHAPVDLAQRRWLDPAHEPPPRPHVVMLDVGEEQAERREQARRRRHNDAAHLELARHARREAAGRCPRTRTARTRAGSRPRSLETARIARIMFDAAITCAP